MPGIINQLQEKCEHKKTAVKTFIILPGTTVPI